MSHLNALLKKEYLASKESGKEKKNTDKNPGNEGEPEGEVLWRRRGVKE